MIGPCARCWWENGPARSRSLSSGAAKFNFYFRAGVREILIVDPGARTVEWFDRDGSGFRPADGSALLGISAHDLRERIDWP
jgi:hypothetical protein